MEVIPEHMMICILLYILLRNIAKISPHSKGWGKDPNPHDRSLSANIERIRLVRNRCVHSCDPSMSITDFNSIWSTIKSTMVDLDAFLMNGNKYEKAVDFLCHESMDPQNDLHYEEELRKQVEEDKTTREMVDNLENKLEKLIKSSIPQNVREQYDIDVEKWREEDKLYYETHSFPSMVEKVRNQPCVTFVGVPGSGKSATAHHIALKLREEGYEVVPVDEIREIKQYCDTKNPQVFVIDDVVGVFGLQKSKLDVLTDYEQKITQPCMAKSRTLMTCREAVFNETLPYKPFLTKEETVIKLHSSDHALDNHDIKQLLQKYGLNVSLISPALLTSTSRMFPLLCKLFSKEPKFQALGSKFFLNPVQCIIDELDNMQRHNKLNYVTLVLCMLNENSLSKDNFEHKKLIDKKKKTLENCRLELNTDTFKFMDALSAMKGTYTKQCGAQYTFIHDSMFEICAYQYGKQFPDQMLQCMSSSYIANNVKTQTSEPGNVNKVKEKQGDSQPIEGRESSEGKEKESDDKNSEGEESSDLCIRLCEDQYPLLAERLYRDIQNMELYDVFRNQVLKHPQVCQVFIGVLETKSYAELKDLFLSSQGEVDKIASKRERVEDEGERSEWQRQEVLIGRNKRKGETNREYNVRVVSWVIYYGHYQIIEYIVQQAEQHNEVSELFGITGNSPQESRSEMERSGIETCNNQNNRPVEQSTSGIYTCNAKGNEINRLVEQCRLLLLSCYSGDVQTVRVLLPLCKKAINGIGGICRGIYWNRDTPLTTACYRGHVSIVKELVKEGAGVNLQDIKGNTALISACKGGHVSIVEELVKAGADVNLLGKYSNTPLIAACKEGHVSIVEELVKAGADINIQGHCRNTPLIAACDGGHVNIVEELVKAGANVNLQDTWRNTPLIVACEGGHVSIVEELVKAGANVNLQDDDGNTPLIAACNGGHASIVEELVKAGADINLQDRGGNTPLEASCKGGHVSIVEELVKAEADVNLQDRGGNTPLIAACNEGHLSIVEELVKAGADINLQDIKGNTALISACEGGHVSIVEELVKAGVDVNLQDNSIQGNTALISACEGGHVSIVEELVKTGADVNLQDRGGNTPLIAACNEGHVSIVEELVKAGADVNIQDRGGNTPLLVACEGGHVSIVEELVKAGADVNLQDDIGITPLIAACKSGHVSLVEELVKAGADINIQNRGGNTPLIVACNEGHVSIVEELVKAGADVNIQDRGGNTLLLVACEGGHVSIVEELVKAGADVNIQDIKGNTALLSACEGGHVSIVEELMKAGADVSIQDIKGNTALISACEGGHVSIVEELVKAGADINLQDIEGNTPLISACEGGHVSIVEELVKAGADINLQDIEGNTPLISACEGGHVSIVEELVKAGADINIQGNCRNTALIAACEKGHVSIVKELVKVGADVNLQDIWGNTPLLVACLGGHVSIVNELVKAGADVNLQDTWKNTPLRAACCRGHASIIEELVKAGAKDRRGGYTTDNCI
ncbi:ankyrin-2-like [Ostrea edulis]|uniref:ankyrin-2-like n=1 Tax=Ostrea edulis TaxID=37623 RepID=UPI0024AF73A7|nr:ankyrin-2-like [Ostrea edulis]